MVQIGFNLFYSKKLADNSWEVEENSLGAPVPRNYVVDVVALDGGDALFAHSNQKDDTDFGPLSFYNLDGTSTVALGNLPQDDLYKTSSDFRMERFQDTLYLAIGKTLCGWYGLLYEGHHRSFPLQLILPRT